VYINIAKNSNSVVKYDVKAMTGVW